MTKFLQGFSFALAVIVLAGCSSLLDNNEGVFGKAQAANNTAQVQIHVVENEQAQSNEQKLQHIGAWSQGGVETALNKITTNIPPEVVVAKQMNARVEALAGKPDFKEVELIKGIVDDLLTQNADIRAKGEKELSNKDKEIAAIQLQDKQLDAQREDEIASAMQQSDVNAQKADQYKATLTQMDSWGGLGAIWYGVSKLFTHLFWFVIIGGVIFLILRLLASSNPIAASIFAIFDQMGSWLVSTISVIFPKAVSLAGNVASSIYNDTKSALSSVVDSVETVKLQASASGTPATIQQLLDTAELSMTPSDKAMIEQIKLELGWIKPATVSTVVTSLPVSTISNVTVTSNQITGSFITGSK